MTDLSNFEVFMRNYQDMVFAVAVRLLGNAADAEDIAQTVFLKAYEHFDDLARNPAAGGWLKTVTTNLSLNHLTRYRARWRFFSEMRAEEDEREFIEEQPTPELLEEKLAADDDRRVLEAALQRLPAAQRVPLVLFHFQGLGYEEIAAKLGVSLAKLKTDIHRGRRALRKIIAGLGRTSVESGPGRRAPAAPSSPLEPSARRALLNSALAELKTRLGRGWAAAPPRFTLYGA